MFIYKRKYGLYRPLPIRHEPWESVFIDLMTQLPEWNGMDAIFMVVDRFSKLANMVLTMTITTTFELVKLFFDMCVKHHKMPQFNVSDKNTKFTTCFWIHLFWKLSFNMTFHPQIDDQTERANGVLNQYFKNYVSADQKDWGQHLSMVEFYYNSIMHSTTKKSLFELVLGKEVKKSMDLIIPLGRRDHSKEVVEMVKEHEEKSPKPIISWSKFKIDMRNMPTKHESMLNMRLGNMCG